MKDEIKEILDEMKQICDVWVIMDGGVKTYNQDKIHCIYDYITNLQEENKMYAQLKEEYEDIIDKAIEYINNLSNEPNVFRHYGIDGECKKWLLNILTGGDEQYKKKIPEKIPLNYADDRKPEEVYEYLRCSYNQLIDYLKSKGEQI
jgi:hypothetical protein